MTTLALALADADATAALGAALADTLPARAVVLLEGDLGAGKTTLARALLQRLGVRGAVRSPTYTLIERYFHAGRAKPRIWISTASCSSAAITWSSSPPCSLTIPATASRWEKYGTDEPLRVWPLCRRLASAKASSSRSE